jgi:hypothetical protein
MLRSAAMLAELYVLTGRDAGKGLSAGLGPTIFIGRAATNHIRVRDPLASRVHCRVDVAGDGLVLHDNNSGNGTYVNGLRVAGPRRLDDEDEIRVGETRIKVLIEREAEVARWERGPAAGVDPLDDSLGGDALSASSTVDAVRPGAPGVITPAAAVVAAEEVDIPAPAGTPTPEPPPGRPDGRRALREVLPGYRIEARLGGHSRSGIAVYRAQQASLERPVALKVLLAKGPASARQVERFVREARAVARLPHPNIVTIHDVLSRGKLRVLVMEYVAGGSLADRLEGGPLGVEEALRVAECVAQALAYAHAHGVVHRAVKPSNILYAPEAQAYKLGDFGLATEPGGVRTGETSIIDLAPGALLYLAPEVLAAGGDGPRPVPQAGRAGRPDPLTDPRGDVWGLGATLFACLAGKPPFEGEGATELAAAILRDEPPPAPRAPGPVATLISRCLRKDPAERYADGAALLHEVRACLAAASQWSAEA